MGSPANCPRSNERLVTLDVDDGSVCLKPRLASYLCDSCGEEIVVPIDLAAGSRQEYTEDCPVCCRPNVIHVEIEDDGEVRVWAEGE